MALYHFNVTQVSRGKGQSSVASASYISGEKLYDKYYGKTHDYTYKEGVLYSEVLLPAYAPERLKDRETLWNEVEEVEKHPKAQLCYSFNFALQNELSYEENEEIGLFEHIAATQECASKKKKAGKLNTDLVDEKFAFYDAADFEGYWMQGLMEEIEKEIAGGRCCKCENAEEIARFIGCKRPEAVQASIDRYNMHCKNGYDADFLKAPEHLEKVNAPYYVFRGYSGVDTFIGGPRINYDLKVVDPDLDPIPGLYAAGVGTSGWLHGGYAFFGTELSFSFFS